MTVKQVGCVQAVSQKLLKARKLKAATIAVEGVCVGVESRTPRPTLAAATSSLLDRC